MANETWPTHNLALATVASMKKWDRKPADLYPTPEEVTQALLDALGLPKGTLIREPACGDGKLAQVLHRNGYKTVCSDLRHTGYGEGGQDFLASKAVPGCLWTISNPPFKIAEEFIRKALSQTPNVAMLLKSNYWHAARGLGLFASHPPSIEYKLTWRPVFLRDERGENPLMDCSWVVWRGTAGSPTWRPLAKPKQYPRVSTPTGALLAYMREAHEDLGEALRARLRK